MEPTYDISAIRAAFQVPEWLFVGGEAWVLKDVYEAVPACDSCGHQPRRIREYKPTQLTVQQIGTTAYLEEEPLIHVSVRFTDDTYADLGHVFQTKAQAALVALEILQDEAART